jgi:hypothetical protein
MNRREMRTREEIMKEFIPQKRIEAMIYAILEVLLDIRERLTGHE